MANAIAKLKHALETTDLTDYAAIPFWSWNNELDEDALIQQIVEMKQAGMGGFIMHARIGLTTEYLGEKWFSCIDACLKKAKELGMNAWIYDENGWPSGFVGGKLLEKEEYRAQFLEYEVKPAFDADAFCVFEKTNAGFIRLYGDLDGVKEYHSVYLRTSPANTDILNPAVVDAFIKETHEQYYKRFPESFGKELVGFFTDEPQYYRWATPYTNEVKKLFKERYNEDVLNGLVYLFVHDERGYEFRTKYFTAMNELYTVNFYKKLYDWCEAHNCKLTGHSIEETYLCGQMLGGADVMTSYEYEHIPGIDWLGRVCGKEHSPKQIGSVAAQLGKKQVLTETFGCSGNDVTPRELTAIGEYQYFHGVSLMCHHLLPFSMAGQGKHDHPPVFSKQNNWFDQFKVFNDHFTKLGYLISNTTETYDVGVLHPMRAAYLDYVRTEDGASLWALENAFNELLDELRKNGVRFQFIDETILKKYGKAEGDKLVVGNSAYDKIILPKMPSIAKSTYELLKSFRGKILLTDEISYIDGKKAKVELASNISFEEIVAGRGILYGAPDGRSTMTSRTGEFGEFVFIKNLSEKESSTVYIENGGSTYQAFDLETFELTNITDEMTIEKCGSLMLVKSDEAKPEKKEYVSENITSSFAVTDITENYLVMDNAAYSKDGVNFSETANIQKHFETILREDYKGDLYIRQTFTLNDKMPLKLILERCRYKSVTLNGKELALGKNDFDIYFREADITGVVQIGENELVYCVDYYQHEGVHFALFDPMATESVRNCLYYDTHLENTYLKGDFVVNADHSISARKQLPPMSSDNYQHGYPFFKGVVTLQGEYDYDGEGSRILSLEKGKFLVAELSVNGKKADMIFDKKLDITPYLAAGKNEIVIKVRSSLRNLFGPHHYHHEVWGKDVLSVWPTMFTFRGEWKDGPKNFTPEYYCMPFGVDEIKMLKELKNCI
ncbi:MAG: hypothetical protein IJ506_07040 [Clostridia bacterium]|nr:hypothetical protein [Clostridia bacterium]